MIYHDSRDKLTEDILAAIERHGGKIELDDDGHPIICLRVTKGDQQFDGFMYLDEILDDETKAAQERIQFGDEDE